METILQKMSKDIIPGTVKEKTCIGPCGQTKPLSAFYKNPNHADGRASTCKECNRVTDKARYDSIKAERAKYQF